MTDLNAILTTGGPSDARRDLDAAQREATAGFTADFNTFLMLLTTQLRSQDPLNPIESTEFVSQLASFSSVEQQVLTNRYLGDMLEAMLEGGPGALAQWLDREVRAPVPAAFDGSPITVHLPTAPTGATTATLVARNAAGEIVLETAVDADAGSVDWTGATGEGVQLPPGRYDLTVRYGFANGATETLDATLYDRVVEARRDGGQVMLKMASGALVAADKVSGVRGLSPGGAQTPVAAPAPSPDPATPDAAAPVTDPDG